MVIEPAIKKLVIKKGPFVPSSPLPLIEVCHELQPEDFQQGFKSARAAYIEAYTHLKAPKVGARWSSPAVYAAAVETFFERNGTSMVSEPEYFARSYRKIVWGFLHGDALDDPPPVLSASQSLENKQKKIRHWAISTLPNFKGFSNPAGVLQKRKAVKGDWR